MLQRLDRDCSFTSALLWNVVFSVMQPQTQKKQKSF